MKNLKLFDTESDYLAYRDDKEKYFKPNVPLCDDKGKIYYNYPPKPKANGYEYVDLGLPSGTLWATMNVGASKANDAGFFFQWGDTIGYTADQVGKDKQFNGGDYKWSIDGNVSNFSKYTDKGATLELEDDAAHVNMGGDWHMPSPTQIQELLDNTTNIWTTQDGVNGRLFTSKSDTLKSIFIPAAGRAWNGSVHYSGDRGFVWSSVLSTVYVYGGQNLTFDSGNAYLNYSYRGFGFSVRGVLAEN